MKKRFLDRFRYPYLQKRLPENIVPGRGLRMKRVKSIQKGKPLRPPIPSLSSDRGKTPNRSPGLHLRLMRGTLRLHRRKLFGEKHTWLGIDTLERGSLASDSYHPSRIDSDARFAGQSGGALGVADQPPRVSQFRPAHLASPTMHVQSSALQAMGEVWARRPRTEKSIGLLEPRGASPTSQLGATPLPKEHHKVMVVHHKVMVARDSLYSSFQLEEALTKQQERRPSPLLLKLMERSKLRIMYGNIPNREVDKLVKEGVSIRGGLSGNLFRLLESRIDVFLCRIGFFATIPHSRQWIHHGKILVNNKMVTIASYLLTPGDVVSISASHIAPLRESLQDRSRKLQILKGLPSQGDARSAALSTPAELPRSDPIRRASKGSEARLARGPAPSPSQHRKAMLGNEGGWTTPHAQQVGALLSEQASPSGKPAMQDRGRRGRTQSPPNFPALVGASSHDAKPGEIFGRPIRVANDARRERLRWFNVKPPNAEISFRCFAAIYLYSPQQVLLPATVDVERMTKS